METFAVHFNAISGSNQAQGLIDEESMAPKPHPIVLEGTCSGWIWAAYAHLDAQKGVA